jgi:RHS repeat-associated protein
MVYGGGQEEEIANASAVSVKTYLPMGIGMLLDAPGAATQVRYFQQDSLASRIAIPDGTGTVLERLAYDTWGEQRNINGNADPSNTLSAANDRYGYTGQEELDGTRFVNMNGRVYNPVLGRFVSPDPTVSDASNLQALNRYSYALDNPFGYLDPSGFTPLHYQSSFIGFEDNPPIVVPVVGQRCLDCSGLAQLANGLANVAIGSRWGGPQRATRAIVFTGASPAGVGTALRFCETPVTCFAAFAVVTIIDALVQSQNAKDNKQANSKEDALGAGNSASLPPGGPDDDDGHKTIEQHHKLPRQFKDKFEAAGLDIENFKAAIPKDAHRLLPDGLHTGESSWNSQWAKFFQENPGATRGQILDQLANMERQFGRQLGGSGK